MEPVSKDAFEGRCKLDDERFARDKVRIEKLEDAVSRVSNLAVQMGELIKQNNEKVENHENRIDSLEKKPSQWFDRILSGIVGAVIAAVVAAIMASVL